MLHVVQTITSLNPASGGTAQVVPQLSDALVDAGCHVTVAYIREPSQKFIAPRRATANPANAWHLCGRAVWSRDFIRAVKAGLPPGQRCLIHDNGLWNFTNLMAGSFARRFKIPLVISPHGMLEAWALRYKTWKKHIARHLYQQDILDAAALFVVSAESELESLRQAGIRQAVAVVPPGIDLPSELAAHSQSAQMRRILFLSRVHPKKGLLSLVDAWHSVRQPGWKITIAGPDEVGHRAEVEAHIASLGLGADFEFVGEVYGADKAQLFGSADVFVLPTHSENFGVAVAEAMAHGLPVLTTRAAPWSSLEAIGAGWWVEPSVAGIRHGLGAALSLSSEQRSRMGMAGREYVAAHFAWSRTAHAVCRAYAWILGLQGDKPDHVHAH